MNKRDAKRLACKWLADEAQHLLDLGFSSYESNNLSDADQERVNDALLEIQAELDERAERRHRNPYQR